jgi:PAS domain S-box-containing protein
MGRSMREVAPSEAQDWIDLYAQVLRTGEGIRVERELLATGRYLELSAFRVEPPSRRQVAVLFQDITDRKRAEARLRDSEARNAALLSQASAGIAATDGTGRFTFVNDRYCEIVGRPREELLGLSMQALTHPDDHGTNLPLFGEAVAGGPAFEIEKRYLRPDGSVVWVRNSVTAIRDGSGGFQSILAVSIDISDRKAAEEALRTTEAALRKLNETLEARVEERTTEVNRLWQLSQDMLARADYGGMMSAVSPAWGRVLGWSEAELLSRPYATFMHPDDMEPTLAALARMGESGEPARFENRIATSDGGWRPIEWTVAPEPDGLNFIAVGRDLSEAREREVMLHTAQEALRQSQKMEAMGQLTGGVAHDFNNLLTPIIGSLDRLITRGVGSDRERRLMAGALESAERAKTLVQRLLAFARRQPLQATAVDLTNLVQGMADLMGSTLGPKIDVRVEIAPDLPLVRADANQLEMALLNLAVNARDAMAEGGSLAIRATRESVRGRRAGLRTGHYVRLAVADTGAGMDEATAARAIEPFFSTKGIGKGTGLGLSMVHGLAAQLGGGLTIRSRVGEGTTVELWLPVSTEPIREPEPPAPPRPLEAARGRALLVDDEDLVRMSTADMLSDLGFEVIEAGSAEEALTFLRSDPDVDLLVTDHLMPGMTGAQLAKEIRVLRPGLPVLIVSGYAEVDGLAPDLPRLVKPFRAAELMERVTALVPVAPAPTEGTAMR